MKKIIGLSMVFCFGLSLFAFTSADTENVNYSEVSNKRNSFDTKELDAFSEAEESATTSDKGTWAKRYRVWTDFAKTEINSIEKVLNKN